MKNIFKFKWTTLILLGSLTLSCSNDDAAGDTIPLATETTDNDTDVADEIIDDEITDETIDDEITDETIDDEITDETIDDEIIEELLFINSNDGVFSLTDFQIESSSHLADETSKYTTSWDYDDNESEIYESEWYYISDNDYFLKSGSYNEKRTEFKEIKGIENSLDAQKEFKYEASVSDIPENGVTIAQIHNRFNLNDDYKVKRPYLRVYMEYGKINIKETSNDLINDEGEYTTTEGPDYTEGTKFKVQFTTGDGIVNVKIETTSGTLDKDFTPNTSVDGWIDYSSSFYIKAGVYTEGNDTEPIIRFYSIEK